jgi:hypothetical protein
VVLPWVATWSRGQSAAGLQAQASGYLLAGHEGDALHGSAVSGPGRAATQRGKCRRARVGVRRALVDAYSDGREYWESVLLAQRLVRVLQCRMILFSLYLYWCQCWCLRAGC